METLLKEVIEIYREAVVTYNPYATVLMLSGGDDSLTAAQVCKSLGIHVDFVLHGITRTGISETLQFVRGVGQNYGDHYVEADARDAYEKYVLRKGFFGIGNHPAHTLSYHILKRQHFRAAVSYVIRKRKRNRPVLLLNGARRKESRNRGVTAVVPIKADGLNIWVNLINEWEKIDCLDFLRQEGVKRNLVSVLLHRSGECLCGTTQYPYAETRREASYFFPAWGGWLDDLEKRVKARGFCWGWGEDMTPEERERKKREKLTRAASGGDFLPMCQTCIAISDPTDSDRSD